MAIPEDALRLRDMDPSDLVDYQADLYGPDGVLEDDEVATGFILTPYADAAAMGFELNEEVARLPALVEGGKAVKFWPQVQPDKREDPAWREGYDCGLLLTALTSNNPYRRRQRTIVIRGKQK